MAFIGKFNFNNTIGINMTDETYKIRLTLSKNADTELFLAIDKLNSRRRSYRLIELAKLGLHIEGRMHGKLDGLMKMNGPEKEIVKPCMQSDKPKMPQFNPDLPEDDKPAIPKLKLGLLEEYADLINADARLLVKKEHEHRIAAEEYARIAARERDDAANQYATLKAEFDERLRRVEIVAVKKAERKTRRDAKNADA